MTDKPDDYGLDASHYPHPKPKDEMILAIGEIELPAGEYKINGGMRKVEHTFKVSPRAVSSEIQKRDEIIRDLVKSLQNTCASCLNEEHPLTKHADVIKEIEDDR